MCKINESFIFKEMTKERLQGHACIFAANVIFGIYIPISKYLVANCMSGEMLTLFRMWGAAILFWISSIFVKADKVDRRDLALMFVFSLFGVVLNQGVFIYGLGKTSPVDASVIVTMTPLMVLIISALFMGDPVTSRKLTGVFTGAAGAIWLILSANHAVNSTGTASGDLLILLSGLASAIYFAMSKPLTSRHSPITLMKWMFLFASIMFLPITPSITCAPDAFKDNFGAADLAMLLYVVAGATFITYLLIAMAIKRMGQRQWRCTIMFSLLWRQWLLCIWGRTISRGRRSPRRFWSLPACISSLPRTKQRLNLAARKAGKVERIAGVFNGG